MYDIKKVFIYFTAPHSCTANNKYWEVKYMYGIHEFDFVNRYLYSIKPDRLSKIGS